jgi:hypothetical protein
VDLADAAFPIIDRVLQQEGVPLDFRYLVLQESALQGDARSTSDAVGYWQLKHDTATGLGLVMNDAVDERKHLTASTRAAARYLLRNNADAAQLAECPAELQPGGHRREALRAAHRRRRHRNGHHRGRPRPTC